ncbi:MAG: imidazolonepropionase [Anaerolineae bacterium]
MDVDLLIHSAAQLVTCAGGGGEPRRGAAMRDVGVIADGAVAVADGAIVAVGKTDDVRAEVTPRRAIDATGRVVCPGFVDAHTHVVYAGNRIAEFEMRLAGATYLDIMAAGGGIVDTMRATRAASLVEIAAQSQARLDTMLSLGTTTAEVKTGYGLDTATELKLLGAIAQLDLTQHVDLVPTFLGAHALPPEYRERPDDYVALVIGEMLPAAAAWYRASHFAAEGTPCFVDVFCERNAFDVEQSRRVLAAGQALGMSVKAHVDEFVSLGGLPMAVALGATSVDHLDATTAADRARLAASDTVGVVLPAVNFNLGSADYADARALVDAGAAVALATDINPGSAPCPSMPLVMAIACRYGRLLPSEALVAATVNAAHATGVAGRVGSIEVGKQADILVVDGPDYRYLAYEFGGNLVGRVIKAGNIVR